jgi:hypothetical protein
MTKKAIQTLLLATFIECCRGQQSGQNATSKECDALNAKAASLKNETYCSLYDSIIQYGTIFVGNTTDTQSACANRHACYENFSEVVEEIDNTTGCTFQQDTDEMVTFMTELFNHREILKTMTDFICDNEDCYSDVRAEVVGCRDTYWIKSCAKTSTTPGCFESVTEMVDSLSEEDRNEVIGADFTILNSIKKAGEEGQGMNDATSFIGSASFHAIVCMACVIIFTSCT